MVADVHAASDRARQSLNRGRLVDNHQQPAVLRQIAEQRPQRGPVVGQRAVDKPTTVTAEPDRVVVLPGHVNAAEDLEPAGSGQGGGCRTSTKKLLPARAGHRGRRAGSPRYEGLHCVNADQVAISRSRAPCGSGDTTSEVMTTGAMSHAVTAGPHTTRAPRR